MASKINLFTSPNTASSCEWEMIKESLVSNQLPVSISLTHSSDHRDTSDGMIPKQNCTKVDWVKFQNILRDVTAGNVMTDDVDTTYTTVNSLNPFFAVDNSVDNIHTCHAHRHH